MKAGGNKLPFVKSGTTGLSMISRPLCSFTGFPRTRLIGKRHCGFGTANANGTSNSLKGQKSKFPFLLAQAVIRSGKYIPELFYVAVIRALSTLHIAILHDARALIEIVSGFAHPASGRCGTVLDSDGNVDGRDARRRTYSAGNEEGDEAAGRHTRRVITQNLAAGRLVYSEATAQLYVEAVSLCSPKDLG
jgi:hypothetical protein